MVFSPKFGRNPARKDARLPHFSAVTALPQPPNIANWFADTPTWGDLGNSDVGDCVVAAAMHQIMQATSYVNPGHGLIGTAAEAIESYSAIGGYVPGNPMTDQGLTVLGVGGMVEYWAKNGLRCGGVLNRPQSVMQIEHPDSTHWKQAISIFGNLMLGVRLPENVVATPESPFVWDDPTGPVAGLHEIILVGYEVVAGRTTYDLVSWGALYRATEEFLLAAFDEAVVVYNRASLDARGIDPAGIDEATLLGMMARLAA